MDPIQLSSGHLMPVPGLGTSIRVPDTEKRVYNAVRQAIRTGYRHIDTAQQYRNEAEVGAAMADEIKEGTITRADMFITTKFAWVSNRILIPADVEHEVEISLKKLQTDYIDLFLIHFPLSVVALPAGGGPVPSHENTTGYMRGTPTTIVPTFVGYLEIYEAMEKLVSTGKVRSLGVSNFNGDQIKHMCSNVTIKPVCNQVEMHVYFQQKDLLEVCQKLGVILTAFGPLGSPDFFKNKGKDNILADTVICGIAERLEITPAQVCLKWLINKGVVPLPKSENAERMKINMQLSNVKLTEEDMEKIRGIDRGTRYFTSELGKRVAQHPNFPWPSAVLEGSDEVAVWVPLSQWVSRQEVSCDGNDGHGELRRDEPKV